VLGRGFNVPKDLQDELLFKFKSQPKNFDVIFYYDTEQSTFNRVKGLQNLINGTNIEVLGTIGASDKNTLQTPLSITNAKKKELQERFDKFMSGQPNKFEASAIFSIIIECVPLTLLRLHDLTFSFTSKSNAKKRLRVSIVDYIICLLDPNDYPDKHLLFLHRFLLRCCHIPKIFVVNKNFKS